VFGEENGFSVLRFIVIASMDIALMSCATMTLLSKWTCICLKIKESYHKTKIVERLPFVSHKTSHIIHALYIQILPENEMFQPTPQNGPILAPNSKP